MKNKVLTLKEQVYNKIYTEYIPVLKRANDPNILIMLLVLTELFDTDEIDPLEALVKIFNLTLIVRFQESQSDNQNPLRNLMKFLKHK